MDAALIEHFGCPSNQRGAASAPMAGLVQLWDVGANQPVGFSLTTCTFNERAQALDLFRNLESDDILVGDRGYPSLEIFRTLHERGQRFLLRCSVTLNREVVDFMGSDATDATVPMQARNHHGQPDRHSAPIPVRLLKVPLPSGATEVLATNLSLDDGHEPAVLADLYRSRWRVETAFREMKVWHALENFSARFPLGIEQEVMAIQIFMLIAGELETWAYDELAQREQDDGQPEDPDRPRIDTSTIRFNRRMIADAAVRLTRLAVDDLDAVQRLLAIELDGLWRCRSKKRPGRTYPRVRKSALRGFKPKGT